MQQIPDHYRHTRLQRIQNRIVASESNEFALHLEPDDAAMRHPRRQAKHRRAWTTADIEDQLMWLGGHRGGEKHRIDRGPITIRRLPQANPAAQETVFG
jgi:hypothetical protein